MDGTTIAAVVAAVCAMLTALAGGFFGFLGKRDTRARELAKDAEEDVEKLREKLDERDRRLDIVVRAYWQQRDAMAEHGVVPLPIPQEMRRADS